MGILNVTSDSFHSGSRYQDEAALLRASEKMLAEGATILDVGAYSTRPHASEIQVDQESDKLCGAIEVICKTFPEAIVSADTFRASVARNAVNAGAAIVNDVGGGLLDVDMFDTVAKLKVPYILMHNRGNPEIMNSLTSYGDIVGDIAKELSGRINSLQMLGVNDIILDPGFGFAKTARQNFTLLKRLDELGMFGLPLLVGLSRKSMVWRTIGCKPEEALNGTTALHMLALERGANILRVHDVKEAMEAISLFKEFEAG